MSSANLISSLREVVEIALKAADDLNLTDVQIAAIVKSIRLVLEDGLEGSDTVRPYIWNLVRYLGKAYPDEFHSSLYGVRLLSKRGGLDKKRKEEVWMRQALEDGAISVLLKKIPIEAEIRNAYNEEAIVINPLKRSEVINIISKMKGVMHSASSPALGTWSSEDSSHDTRDSSYTSSEANTSEERYFTHDVKSPIVCEESDIDSTAELKSLTIDTSVQKDVKETKGRQKSTRMYQERQQNLETKAVQEASHRPATDSALEQSLVLSHSNPSQPDDNVQKPEDEGSTSLERSWNSSQQDLEIQQLTLPKSKTLMVEERTAAALVIMKELTETCLDVVQQYNTNNHPLSLQSYSLCKLCSLYGEVMSFGMCPCPSYCPYGSVQYMLDMEKILTDGKASSFALLFGLQKFMDVKGLAVDECKELDVTDSEKFKHWLHLSLLDQTLGTKMESVLSCQEFLQGWYYPRAILTDPELSKEFLASCHDMDQIEVTLENFTRAQNATIDDDLESSTIEDQPMQAFQEEDNKDSSSDQHQDTNEVLPDVSEDSVTFHDESQDTSSQDACISQSAIVTPFANSELNNLIPDNNSEECHVERQDLVEGINQNLLIEDLLHSVKIRSGSHGRTSPRRVSSCQTAEEEEDWSGVWKDIDVIRYEFKRNGESDKYAVYVIEVMASDGTQWQTARRFSEIIALRKMLIKKKSVSLPHSWSNLSGAKAVIGKARFSRDILEARLALIRQCLWDFKTAFPEALVWQPVSQFLDAPLSILKATKLRQRQFIAQDPAVHDKLAERVSRLRTGMVLIVDLPTPTPNEVLFEIQQGRCPGCQGYLPGICHHKSMFKTSPSPRKCAYTELLYCHDCHHLETALLPSKVLHEWDFRRYIVSTAAKKYIVSTFPQPVLSINIINPGLLASIPVLGHLQYLRLEIIQKLKLLKQMGDEGQKIAETLEKKAGYAVYLLQNAEYWSLKDLGDISRGIFATLPQWIEVVHSKITKLIMS